MDPNNLQNILAALGGGSKTPPNEGQNSSLGLSTGASLGPQSMPMAQAGGMGGMSDQSSYPNPFFNQQNPQIFGQSSPYAPFGSQAPTPQAVMNPGTQQ